MSHQENKATIKLELERICGPGFVWEVVDGDGTDVQIFLSAATSDIDPDSLEPFDVAAGMLAELLSHVPDGTPLGEEGEDGTLVDFLCNCGTRRSALDYLATFFG